MDEETLNEYLRLLYAELKTTNVAEDYMQSTNFSEPHGCFPVMRVFLSTFAYVCSIRASMNYEFTCSEHAALEINPKG